MVAQHWAMVCVTGPVLRQRWKKHNVLVMGKIKLYFIVGLNLSLVRSSLSE